VRQNILEAHPDADLVVYTVWMPMLTTDAREEWDASELPDDRVTHFWDGDRVLGTWLAERDVGGSGFAGVVWDAFFVFGPEAGWGTEPGPLLGAGAPVIDDTDELDKVLLPLLG
jgi:hypothetical protein